MRRTGSGADSLRPLSRVIHSRQPTASEEFKAQLSYSLRYLYTSLQETKDEFHSPTASFSDGARKAYPLLLLIEGRLARDETIVEAELEQDRKALQVVESETKKEQAQFQIEIGEAFRYQQAQRELDTQRSEIRDRIREREVVALREKLERHKVDGQLDLEPKTISLP